MKQAFLQWQWSPRTYILSSIPSPLPFIIPKFKPVALNSAALSSSVEEENLTAKERRKLRNERRESKTVNWREEVEERLIEKPKKRYASWTEELNLDNLADLGPQWWVVRLSRVAVPEFAERLAHLLARNYPEIEFKVYIPAVLEKRKLKNGSYTVKSKPLFPRCVFLRCVLNKEIHDFMRECDGVGGFVGSKVGNTKRQITRPKPVSEFDMEEIFQQAKAKQEKADQDELERRVNDSERLSLDTQSDINSIAEAVEVSKKNGRSKNALNGRNKKLRPGSTVRVLSGAFAHFSGILKKLDCKNGKATVEFALFGKETIADLDIHEIVVETE
ncbi:hypothetical protein Nepgr_012043 [Nepenthes gracilis]|uniref:NusG-like N-terminal domain-containing protein n=1 Tax=Nepenthes gracilis TaxID=150966 RepID=A0AAD3SGL8_NEPGR|nr:hypothetical protein Nepgr_012043 [Nepenthes gracilis]